LKINNCIVCGENSFEILFHSPKSMSSDMRILPIEIKKEGCTYCGFVRSTSTEFLEGFYKNDYTLNNENLDPIQIYKGQKFKRSELIFDWIMDFISKDKVFMSSFDSVIEIGCGSGNLLERFKRKKLFGIEPNKTSFDICSQKFPSENILFEELSEKIKFDLVISVCVIEHTINPLLFLEKCKNILADEGYIVLILPIQDLKSYDPFFLDHLHHFSRNHIINLLDTLNLQCVNSELGYKCIEDQGVFFIKKRDQLTANNLERFKNKNFEYGKSIINKTNIFLEKQMVLNKKIIAFGYGERSFFLQAYAQLENYIEFYIDDVKTNKYSVKSFSQFSNEVDFDESLIILLLINPHYNKFIIDKFSVYNDIIFLNPFEYEK